MVGVPVPEMLNVSMLVLDLPKHLLLVLAVLEETDGGPARLGSGFDDAGDMDFEFSLPLVKRANDAASGFVLIEAVAFIKNRCKCGLWNREVNLVGAMEFHSESPFLQI